MSRRPNEKVKPDVHKERLTPLEQRYCRHLVAMKTPNQGEAYIAAGGAPKNAGHGSTLLMRKQRVVTEIARLQAEQFKRLEMSGDEALAIAAAIGRACMADAYHDNGTLKMPNEWDPNLRHAVIGLKTEQTDGGARVVDLKLDSKQGALNLILRKHGLLKDKVEVSADESLAALVLRGQRIRQARLAAQKAGGG